MESAPRYVLNVYYEYSAESVTDEEEVSQAKTWTERGSCHLVAARGTMGDRDRKWKVPLEGPAE